MDRYKIKVLKDTLYDSEGTELSVSDFIKKYDCENSYEIRYGKNTIDIDLWFENQLTYPDLNKWFSLIELKLNNFRVGDWVWHEILEQAFVIAPTHLNKPNVISFASANSNINTYKRLASQKEINDWDLIPFDDNLLVGKKCSYYFDTVWYPIKNIKNTVQKYITSNVFDNFCISDSKEYSTQLNGLKIGCKIIPHNDIMKIAKILELIP